VVTDMCVFHGPVSTSARGRQHPLPREADPLEFGVSPIPGSERDTVVLTSLREGFGDSDSSGRWRRIGVRTHCGSA